MGKERNIILSFRQLEIGFRSGKSSKILLPPLDGDSKEGELIAVIGKNGVGKSTMLRTLTGLQQSIQGNLTIENRNIKEFTRNTLSSKVGYISTEVVKVSNMRVRDLVALGRFPHTNWIGSIKQTDKESIEDALRRTGMEELADRPVTQISDGERQRAMIAMVLAQDPQVMILDEPTAFLDISSRYDIIHLLHELTRKRNKLIIFSTHDLNIAINQADKIWLLKDDGLTEGSPEDLMINGLFSDLFDESKVRFNRSDGSFTLRNEERGSLFVKGTGENKYWTEKALIRAGYDISDSGSDIIIETPSETNINWICSQPDKRSEFRSVYDLVNWFREEDSFC